jgi:hypothetical protein
MIKRIDRERIIIDSLGFERHVKSASGAATPHSGESDWGFPFFKALDSLTLTDSQDKTVLRTWTYRDMGLSLEKKTVLSAGTIWRYRF